MTSETKHLSSIGQDWVAKTGKEIRDKQGQTESTHPVFEEAILYEVAEKVNIFGSRYYELVSGQEGEVPAEFDQTAMQILQEAMEEPILVAATKDKKILEQIFDELEEDASKDTWAVRRVRDMLFNRAEATQKVAELSLVDDRGNREKLSEHYINEAVSSFEATLNDRESPLQRAYELNRTYLQEIGKDFPHQKFRLMENTIGMDALNKSEENANRFINLHSQVAKSMLGRASENKSIVLSGNLNRKEDVVTPLPIPLDRRTLPYLESLVDVSAETVRSIYRTEGEQTQFNRATPYPSDKIPLYIGLTESGLVIGASIVEKNITSKKDLDEALDKFRQAHGMDVKRNLLGNIKMDELINYEDNCYAAYAITRINSLNPKDVAQIYSIQVSLEAIKNDKIREIVKKAVKDMETGNNRENHPAVALILGEPIQLGYPDGDRLQERLKEYEQETVLKEIDNIVYTASNAVFIGRSLDSEDIPRFDTNLHKMHEYRKAVEKNIVKREATLDVLRRVVSLDKQRSNPPLSEKDILTVLENLQESHSGLTSSYNVLETVLKGNLSDNQKRLLMMIRLSHIVTAGYNSYQAFPNEAQQYFDTGLIKEEDIVDAYNSAALAVHTANKKHPDMPEESSPIITLENPMEVFRRPDWKGKFFNADTGVSLFSGTQINLGGGRFIYSVFRRQQKIPYNPYGHTEGISNELHSNTSPTRIIDRVRVFRQLFGVMVTHTVQEPSFEEITKSSPKTFEAISNQLRQSQLTYERIVSELGWDQNLEGLVNNGVWEIEKMISQDGGILRIENELSERILEARGLIGTINTLKRELERIGIDQIGMGRMKVENPLSRKKTEREAIARDYSGEILEKIKQVVDIAPSDTRFDNLRFTDTQSLDVLTQTIYQKMQIEFKKLKSAYIIVEDTLERIPDLTEHVANKILSNVSQGVVTTSQLSNDKITQQEVPIELVDPELGYGNDVGYALTQEIDLSKYPYRNLAKLGEGLKSNTADITASIGESEALKKLGEETDRFRMQVLENLIGSASIAEAREILQRRLKEAYSQRVEFNRTSSRINTLQERANKFLPQRFTARLFENIS